MTYEDVLVGIKATLSNRDSRRDQLAARIEDVTDRALRAARVRELRLPTAGTLRWEMLYADCSQGGYGSGWPVTRGSEEATVLVTPVSPAAVRTVLEPDLGFFDGHNLQRQIGPLSHGGDEYGEGAQTVVRATVAELRAVARELPEAVAALFAETVATATREAAEAEAADAALAVAAAS